MDGFIASHIKSRFLVQVLLLVALWPLSIQAQEPSAKSQVQLHRWLAHELNQSDLSEGFKGLVRTQLEDRDRFLFEKRMRRWAKPSQWQVESVGSRLILSLNQRPFLSLRVKSLNPVTIVFNDNKSFVVKKGQVAASVVRFLKSSNLSASILREILPQAVAASPQSDQRIEDFLLFYSGGVVSAAKKDLQAPRTHWQSLNEENPWSQDVLGFLGRDSWITEQWAESVTCEPGRRVKGRAEIQVPKSSDSVFEIRKNLARRKAKTVSFDYEFDGDKLKITTDKGSYNLVVQPQKVTEKQLNALSPGAVDALLLTIPDHGLYKKFLKDESLPLKGQLAQRVDEWVGSFTPEQAQAYCEKTGVSSVQPQCSKLTRASEVIEMCRQVRAQIEKKRNGTQSEAASLAEIHKGCLYDLPSGRKIFPLKEFVRRNASLESLPPFYTLQSGSCESQSSEPCYSQLEQLWDDLVMPKRLHREEVSQAIGKSAVNVNSSLERLLVGVRRDLTNEAETQMLRLAAGLKELKNRCDEPELRAELWDKYRVRVKDGFKSSTTH